MNTKLFLNEAHYTCVDNKSLFLQKSLMIVLILQTPFRHCQYRTALPNCYITRVSWKASPPHTCDISATRVSDAGARKRFIPNTSSLLCNINLHQFAPPRQRGIQSTPTLCQPHSVSFFRGRDTKKLAPCIFITITREETTDLIEYVIAQGIEVGLGSLRR